MNNILDYFAFYDPHTLFQAKTWRRWRNGLSGKFKKERRDLIENNYGVNFFQAILMMMSIFVNNARN